MLSYCSQPQLDMFCKSLARLSIVVHLRHDDKIDHEKKKENM